MTNESLIESITKHIDAKLRDAGLPKSAGEAGIYSDFIVRETLAYLQRCEISVVNDAFNTHISEKPRSYDSFADYRDGFFEGYYSASHKPVSISLEILAAIVHQEADFHVEEINGTQVACVANAENVVRAVLDAAGVKYAD